MTLLPGILLVTVLVRVGSSLSALVFPPQELLHGLQAARHALSFAEVSREDWRPEELLPWAGNV
jgi:hypothetical protein